MSNEFKPDIHDVVTQIGFAFMYCAGCRCVTRYRVTKSWRLNQDSKWERMFRAHCVRPLGINERHWQSGLAVPEGSLCGQSLGGELLVAVAVARAVVEAA